MPDEEPEEPTAPPSPEPEVLDQETLMARLVDAPPVPLVQTLRDLLMTLFANDDTVLNQALSINITEPTDWSPEPEALNEALGQLAARLTIIEGLVTAAQGDITDLETASADHETRIAALETP